MFSKDEETGEQQFHLIISGGSPDKKKNIIAQFASALTRMVAEDSGEEVGEPELQKNDKKNIWRAKWTAKAG